MDPTGLIRNDGALKAAGASIHAAGRRFRHPNQRARERSGFAYIRQGGCQVASARKLPAFRWFVGKIRSWRN